MKMTKIIGGSIAVAAALVLNTQAQNLLINGDFENAAGFTANPVTLTSGINGGWAVYDGNTYQSDMFYSPDTPESGSYALLSSQVPGNAAWAGEGGYEIISGVVPGATYLLSAWELTDTMPVPGSGYPPGSPQFGIQLDFTDSTLAGLGGNTAYEYVNAINTWQLVTCTATAPANATYFEIYFQQATMNTYGYNLNAYYDNGSLTMVPEPGTMALLGMGLAIPFYFIRRKS